MTKILNENLQKLDKFQNLASADLENDLLTSTTSEWAQWILPKITFLKSGDQAEKNEL